MDQEGTEGKNIEPFLASLTQGSRHSAASRASDLIYSFEGTPTRPRFIYTYTHTSGKRYTPYIALCITELLYSQVHRRGTRGRRSRGGKSLVLLRPFVNYSCAYSPRSAVMNWKLRVVRKKKKKGEKEKLLFSRPPYIVAISHPRFRPVSAGRVKEEEISVRNDNEGATSYHPSSRDFFSFFLRRSSCDTC